LVVVVKKRAARKEDVLGTTTGMAEVANRVPKMGTD